MQKKILVFIPHIRGGGVEKNFFLLTNFLSKKTASVSVITVNKEYKSNLDKRIKIIAPKSNSWKNSSIYVKNIMTVYLNCLCDQITIQTLLCCY